MNPDILLGLKSGIILSAAITRRYIASFIPDKMKMQEFDLTDMPEKFRDAAEWMIDRAVMSKTELKAEIDFLARQFPDIDVVTIENRLRGQVQAMALNVNANVRARVQRTITRAIGDGLTRVEFLEVMDELISTGVMPGGIDGYLRNVFRTETARAYAEQREEWYRDPALTDHFWGIECFNPADDASRESHARLNGALFRRGSDAYNVLGIEPYDFMCRCGRAPVVLIDPNVVDFEESDNAMELAINLERF